MISRSPQSNGEDDHSLSSDEKYLSRLTFNPELRKTWLNFFVSRFRVVVLLILVIVLWGLYSFYALPRESNPEVVIPIAVVSAVYPGASPADVEEFVTKKIETEIAGLKGLKTIVSNSQNSLSVVQVEFDAKQDINESIRSLRDKISNVKPKLPAEANDPIVREISLDDTPIWSISLTGPYDGFTLRKYAEDVQDELSKISGVREVTISGGDVREFEVAYIPSRLELYGISPSSANQAIVALNSAIPSGNFETNNFIFPIRSDGRVYDADSIKNIPVSHSSDGSIVSIKDIANVSEKAVKKTTYSRFSIGGSESKNSVSLSVIKRSGASVIDTVKNAKIAVDRSLLNFPPGIKYDVSMDYAKLIERDFNQLSHDFLLTLLLVFGVLFLIVGLKEAFVAGLAIPLVFFVSFGVLLMNGISLNFLSLFSLILSLGLLVDDAIVVVSATKQYLNSGKFTPEEAVLLVLTDFKWVLTTTTLTTVWAFLPMLFSSGIMGQYIKSIPITVSITLIASLLIALMVNHPLAAILERMRVTRRNFVFIELIILAIAGYFIYVGGTLGYILGALLLMIEIGLVWWYEKRGREIMLDNEKLVDIEWESDEAIKNKLREQARRHDTDIGNKLIHGIIHFNLLLPYYEKSLRYFVMNRKRRIIMLVSVFLIFAGSVSLVVTGVVKSEFFPASDSDYAYVDIRTPIGSTLSLTDSVTRQVEEKLLNYKDIANFSTIIGAPSPMNQGGTGASNISSITMTLKDKSKRSMKAYEFADVLRKDLKAIDGGIITVATPAGGPPSGAAFEAHISGDDLGKLTNITHDIEPLLSSIPGVVNVDISLKDSVPEYTFTLNAVKLAQNNLNAAYVGSFLRMAISGFELTTVVKDEKEVKIMATFNQESIPDLQAVQNLQILNLMNQPVFLKDVANIKLNPAVDSITRIDQKRTVKLTAGVSGTTNATSVLADFQKKVADYPLPAGYSIKYGGENEQNAESVLSILRAMIIAMVLIVATLVIQFNSFKKAIIVLVTIPLALIGVFVGMAIFNVSLSFPGLIGILALFGIVVKNAIILVDKINLNIKTGIPFTDSIIDAGRSRLEAIFITSICTILGILPISLSNEMWRSLGGAVIFGLSISSLLTLFIVPALYLSFIKESEKF